MSREYFEEILDYYQREMMYLRHAGDRFSQRYPKVAQNLDLSYAGSSDPHVERLLESFAFLTARLQKEVDNKFVRFANTLLDVTYPHFTRPFPSSAIAHCRISPKLGKNTFGYELPKGTQLYTESTTGQTCRFQTSYPVKLWPMDVVEAKLLGIEDTFIPPNDVTSDYVLRLRIERDDGPLSDVEIDNLRIHISGDHLTTNFLYDAIFSYDAEKSTPIYIQPDSAKEPVRIKEGSLTPVGFDEDDNLVPYPNQVHSAYRLLQEYFIFPQKFKFFDLENLDTSACDKYIDVYIPLAAGVKPDRFRVSSKNFKLSCVPIVNLFKKISEPIDLNHQSVSYRLVADQREEEFTEIHSIEKVQAAVLGEPDPIDYSPYFSYRHKMAKGQDSLFWSSHRLPCSREDVSGSDVFLTFVDFDFKPDEPADQTIFAHLLCTNRDLPKFVPAGAQLHIEDDAPATTITCIERPTAQVNAVMEGESLWRVVSQLSLNHLTLSGVEGIGAFKELLRLYAQANKAMSHEEINALESISYETVTRRIHDDSWRGFAQGLGVTLATEDLRCDGNSAYLLGAVLSRFMSLYVGMNSFVELSLKSNQMPGVWKQWPAQIGNQKLL